MAKKLNDDERPALEGLAHQDGCAEAVLLADGFSIDQLAGLVVGGYAVLQRRRVEISGREKDSGLGAGHRRRAAGDLIAPLRLSTPAATPSQPRGTTPGRFKAG
jgi:hypothetical protein